MEEGEFTIDTLKENKIDFKNVLIEEGIVKVKEPKGIIRVRTNPFPRLQYGDEVKLSCRLEKPENTTFDYQRYLARYHIYSLCFRAKIEKTGKFAGNPAKQTLLSIKNFSLQTIEAHINEPESSLIGPVLFGGQNAVDDDIFQNFRRTGLTHIMAVSGFNVGILALGFGYIFFALGLRRRLVFILTALSIIAYVILVGAPAYAVRAGIMSIIILAALAIGRVPRITNVVVLAAAGSLAVNPLLLTADIGWQLSFLAVLGLIYLYPLLKKLFDYINPKKIGLLSDMIAATLAAQLATTPITLYNFGQISIISLLSNILVVWTISFLTTVSALALPIAALIPPFGDIVFLPSMIIAKYILWIVELTAKPGWASVDIGKISLVTMILSYAVLGLTVLLRRTIVKEKLI